MTGYSKVFPDTTPLIYFLDADERYGEKTRVILEAVLSSGKPIVSSVITCTEYLVYPFRTGNQQKVDAFFEFVDDGGIELVEVDLKIARKAARIRASMGISRRWIRFNWPRRFVLAATPS